MPDVLPFSVAQCADVILASVILSFAATVIGQFNTVNERMVNTDNQNAVIMDYIHDDKYDNTTIYAQDITSLILECRETKYVVLNGHKYETSDLCAMDINEIHALSDNSLKYHAQLIYASETTREVEGYQIDTE